MSIKFLKRNIYFVSGLYLILPFISFAQGAGDLVGTACSNLTCFIQRIIGMFDTVVLILIGVALIVFLWGLIKYLKSIDDKTRQEAIGTITYGIISLFVMISVWGLVNLLTNTFGFDSSKNSVKTQNINPKSLIK